MRATKRASVTKKSPRDDLLGSPAPSEAFTSQGATGGNAQQHEHLRQTTILAYDEQLSWLDEKCIEARRNGGKAIRKAVIIRSLIDLARSAEVDLSGLSDEGELVTRFEQAIKAK
jgi:hypothetical protein